MFFKDNFPYRISIRVGRIGCMKKVLSSIYKSLSLKRDQKEYLKIRLQSSDSFEIYTSAKELKKLEKAADKCKMFAVHCRTHLDRSSGNSDRNIR